VLRYHSIRPGDRLAFHNNQTIRKLLATVNCRFFFIPISHKGHFTLLDDATNSLPVILSDLGAESTFPFHMQYKKRSGGSADHGLPCGVPLLVQGLISENAVLATKIYDTKTFPAFFLPLRTQITVGVEAAAIDKANRNIFLSDENSFAEEVSEEMFNRSGICTTFVHVSFKFSIR